MTRQRRGYALIEMLAVMSGLVIILGVCVGLIHTLLRLERVARGHLTEATRRDQIARQFRRDARAASTWSPKASDDAGRVVLNIPGGNVVDYEVHDRRLERIEHAGDRIVRRERYSLPSAGPPRLQIRTEGTGTFVSLVYTPKAGAKDGSKHREFRVDALLGRDRRLSLSMEAAK